MRILIAGSTGLIGTELVHFLQSEGHDVRKLVRAKKTRSQQTIFWDPYGKTVDLNDLEGFDAFINLAGENIASGRWTNEKKRSIYESRASLTSYLCQLITRLKMPPKTLINASAIGIYGNRGEQVLEESSSSGEGFLADVCKHWEEATEPAVEKGVRVVNLRIGMVLSKKGGALAKMLTPFKLGLGGKLGSGQQYMSWIALEDLVKLIVYCLNNEEMSGPVNAVSPHPVKNLQFTKLLGKALNRPTFFSVPSFAVKLAFGEMGKELLLSSNRVHSAKLSSKDFQFEFPQLEGYFSSHF